MRTRFAILTLLLLAALLPACTISAAAQSKQQYELGFTYDWTHTNAPPKACGCFSLNGGGVEFAYRLPHSFSAVAAITAGANGNVINSGKDLRLVDYLAGIRYTTPGKAIHPYGQLLLGAAHVDGALSPSNLGVGATNGFAMSLGAGADVPLNKTFALRALQVDYLLTKLPNGVNDRQNNLRLSTGLVVRW